jgi:predicted transcriptional regulator
MLSKFLFDTFNLKISENEAIGWAQKNGLVSTSMVCSKCCCKMKLENSKNVKRFRLEIFLKLKYRCSNKFCRTSKSIFFSSLFFKTKTPLSTWLLFIYYWSNNFHLKIDYIAKELNVHKSTISRWSELLRKLILASLLSSSSETKMIGGEFHIVEVDESCFNKRKYHKGSKRNHTWVIGEIDKVTNEIFLKIVDDRKKTTCHRVLSKYIHKKSIGNLIFINFSVYR